MNNQYHCQLCQGMSGNSERHILKLTDSKNSKLSKEFNGCKNCIDQLEEKIKSVGDLSKVPLKKVLEVIQKDINDEALEREFLIGD